MKSTVLIVEDNSVNLELVTDLLEVNGFTVLQARTAEEGLRLACELKPQLILMDWSLPGMDGLAATKALKSNPLTSGLPVVALTAHAMRGDAELALRAGCDGYLSKPVDTRTLPRKVAEFINSARVGAPGPAPIAPNVDSLNQ